MEAKICRTIQGDTFDLIAWRLWNDEHQCRRLMEANPEYMDVLLFEPGTELNIPAYSPAPKIPGGLPPWFGGSNA